jgi:5-(carboxyamino)imidazole ribonucleotide synthase
MSAILPGATLGVLGGGQLGRMFVHAAQRMGYYTAVLDPDPLSPAGCVAHYHIQGDTSDDAALAQLMQRCAAITTEFENVSAPAMSTLAAQRVVSPHAQHVAMAQNRIEEKAQLSRIAAELGIPFAAPVRYIPVEKLLDITTSPDECFPGLLKTATLGYDGKGQVKVNTRSQASIAFKQLGSVPCVLEQWTPLAAECSVVLARGADGQVVCLPVARNTHLHGILASSEVFEGNLPPALAQSAQDAAKSIANQLQYVGVLCVEFFALRDAHGGLSANSELRVNEIAPRPHNSGHWSMEGSSLSQFELQVRSLCGLPLPEPEQHAACVMLNLLGDSWLDSQGQERTPNWPAVLALPGVHLHLYGKLQARKGRKMGHITITGSDAAQACQKASAVAQLLELPYSPALPAA